jgi:hypothetical protein
VNVEGVELPALRKDTLFRYRRREFFAGLSPGTLLTIAEDGV